MDSQAIRGDGNIQVLLKDSPHSYVVVDGKAVDLWVPKFRRELDPDRNKDLDLLLAPYAITDLTGRDRLWEDCLDWCDHPDPVSVRCITGPGGCGKTRLALELVHRLRERSDWDARFVRFLLAEPFDLWAETTGPDRVLLVFDYAPIVLKPLTQSLHHLTDHLPKESHRRLRVLLLARTASWDGGWLASLKPRSTVEDSVADLFRPVEPIVLAPLDQTDRVALFSQALKRSATFAGVPVPPLPDPILFAQDRAARTLRDPLTLIMAAVIGVRNGVPQALSLSRAQLAYEAAELLVASRLEDAFPENPQLAHHMAAYLTLCGGLSRTVAQDVLERECQANHLGRLENPGSFIDRLQAWFPGDETEIGPIGPTL